MKTMHIFVVLLSLSSFVISVSLVIYLYHTGKDYGIKSVSFGDTSVAVLCAIVGLLVGWNIYSALDLKKDIDKLESKTSKLDERCKIISENTSSALIDIQEKTKTAFAKQESYIDGCIAFCQGMTLDSGYMRYYMFMSAISHFCDCQNDVHGYIDSCLKRLRGTLNEMSVNECLYIDKNEGFSTAKNNILKSKYLTKNQSEELDNIERERIYKINNL